MDKFDITADDIIATDGIIVIDKNKNIIVLNEAAQRITGYSENDILSRQYTVLFSKDDSENEFIENALKNGESFSNLSLPIICSGNLLVNVLVSITPLKPTENEIAGVVLIMRNMEEMGYLVSSLRQKTEEMLNERNKLNAIFNSRMEGTFTIDNDWNITMFNASAERITGYSKKEAIGKKCWEVFQSSVCRNGCHMEYTLRNEEKIKNDELVIIRKNNDRLPIRVNSAPLFDASGKQVGGVETFQDISEIRQLTKHIEERYQFDNIIGHSKAMQKVYTLIDNVVQSDSTVMLTGESGTGKELVARAIHLNSARKLEPFIAINCSAFVETLLESELFGHERGAFTGATHSKTGRFELAKNGTLFLDEIGDISPTIQVKLLRVLETRKFERVGGIKEIDMNVRIIAATNKNLQKEIKAGRFRKDLYYRLNVINIELPPFRDRLEDLPLLLDHFLSKFREKFNKPIDIVAPSVLRIFHNYQWPGNIRELENVLEHAFVLCHDTVIKQQDLPERLTGDFDEFSESPEKMNENPVVNAERNYINNMLKRYKSNRTKTAEALGIDKSTLWRKMKKYNLLKD